MGTELNSPRCQASGAECHLNGAQNCTACHPHAPGCCPPSTWCRPCPREGHGVRWRDKVFLRPLASGGAEHSVLPWTERQGTVFSVRGRRPQGGLGGTHHSHCKAPPTRPCPAERGFPAHPKSPTGGGRGRTTPHLHTHPIPVPLPSPALRQWESQTEKPSEALPLPSPQLHWSAMVARHPHGAHAAPSPHPWLRTPP